jgi:DNA topoisomerase-2
MWSGSMSIEETPVYCVFGEEPKYFARDKKILSDTLRKIFDEIRVNAIDQVTLYKDLVTRIDMTFDEKGFCTIRNNGTAIPIEVKKDRNGKSVFIPEMIFTQEMSGSNLEAGVERNVGGQNGIGAKLTNVWSVIFTYSMCWNGIHYAQTCRDGMAVIEKPVITPLNGQTLNYSCEYTLGDISKLKKEDKESHVKISFLPDYAALKYDIAQHRNDLATTLEYDAYMTAAFTGKPVYFNQYKIELMWESFVLMHKQDKTDYNSNMLNLLVQSPERKNPWIVCITTKSPCKFKRFLKGK